MMSDRILPFHAFVETVGRISRQQLTTMAKRISLTPHRRKGEWVFRDPAGAEVPVAEVYERLERSPRGRAWLREQYEIPLRAAQRRRDREKRIVAELTDGFRFLTDAFDYSEPFRIPAIESVAIVAWRNSPAQRQVEVSNQPTGPFYCEIRRLVNGEPGAYDTDSMGAWELYMMRECSGVDPLEAGFIEGDREGTAALLRRHPDILLGEAWIERAAIDETFEASFLRQYHDDLPPAAGEPYESGMSVARRLARVLVDELGFRLELDTDALSPHEQPRLWAELRYRRGGDVVSITNSDIRIATEWSLRLNGVRLEGDWENFEAGLRGALERLRARL